MILDGMVYECIDDRRGVSKMTGYAMLNPIPGGFEVWHLDQRNERLLIEDDDSVEEKGSLVTFYTDSGQLHFLELTLADYERLDSVDLPEAPKFKTTEALRDYIRVRIEN